MGLTPKNCPMCAEELPAQCGPRCPACGENLGPRPPAPGGWGSPEKPAGIAVIAALNLVFGGLTAIGLPFSILGIYMMRSMNLPGMPFMNTPGYMTFVVVSMFVGLVGAVCLLSSGFGLFYMRPWARQVALGYALFLIVWTVAAGVANYALFIKPMLDSMNAQGGPGAGGPAGAAGGMVGGLFGSCFNLLLPVATLIVLTRPSVNRAFGIATPAA